MRLSAEDQMLLRGFSTPILALLATLATLLCVGVVVRWGFTATALAYAFFVVSGLWLSAIDLRLRILPNRIVVPSIGLGLVLLVVAALADHTGQWPGDAVSDVLRVVLGSAVLFVLYLALALISPRGLGMGDVKFAAFIGMYLAYVSWDALLLGAVAGFIGAAIVGIVMLTIRRVGWGATIPFGPMMFGGAALVLAL
jgi:leader peptidase (prepilin peptidase)/N-methyltransferase